MTVNYWGKGAIQLRYTDCEQPMFIPPGHTEDHQHCYACRPELAKEPLAGCCEDCGIKREQEAHRTDWLELFRSPPDCAQFCAHHRALLSATDCHVPRLTPCGCCTW